MKDLTLREVEKDIAKLKKNSFILKEEFIDYRGFNRKDIDSVKLEEYGDLYLLV